ncbi:MAG: Glutamate synthase small chain [Myxococcaceae bacterium]|nr:Glutamate synthase small chain [Myxococcaceae bacterium]
MGDPRGFIKLGRSAPHERAIPERLADWNEFVEVLEGDELRAQASRCMDCGIPFCHVPLDVPGVAAGGGCPLGNVIPEWNDLAYRGRMDDAAQLLHSTNNFPEITGRVCPAPCEASCVLALDGDAVHIKGIEKAIAEHAFEHGLTPVVAESRTGRRVAVIGSGPAGLAVAQELARRGHDVTVYEKDDRIGGLLRYGIPDFKLDRGILDVRLAQMEAEGVRFVTGADFGGALSFDEVRASSDVIVLAAGARRPRELDVPGRELAGVHLAMDFLTAQNKVVAGDSLPDRILATGKRVVVLGGGDTGADCVGTSHRQKAASVLQLELMPRPPGARVASNPWPGWPLVLRSSTSHAEGGTRDWAVLTKRVLAGEDGGVRALEAVRVQMDGGRLTELEASTFEIPCDLVLLAMGFTGPEASLLDALPVEKDARGNVKTDELGATSVPGVFAAGDVVRGQSLVVWAIADGRRVAHGVDRWLARLPVAAAVYRRPVIVSATR